MNLPEIEQAYRQVADYVFSEMAEMVEDLSQDCTSRMNKGAQILVCGNGGSAGDAQHFVGELVNRFLLERRPFAGVALTTDTSVITAIGNDYSYDEIFSKQVEALGRPGDILFGISTSGNAANVCRAFDAARERGMLTVAMTGGHGGELAANADVVLSVACSTHTPRIQEGHQLLIHLFCERLEELLTESA